MFCHFAEVLGRLASLTTELGIGRVKRGHIFDELLASFVLTVEFLLVAASIANSEDFFLLNFESALGILALAAKDVFMDKP